MIQFNWIFIYLAVFLYGKKGVEPIYIYNSLDIGGVLYAKENSWQNAQSIVGCFDVLWRTSNSGFWCNESLSR